jgi:2-phospho-L-lactate transferase/gluconeogenesis factor (CofD/UPF0052 family)
MASAGEIRNKIIDQLMSIKDTDFLSAISSIIDRANVQSETVPLTEEQKTMLTLSEADIDEGRVIDQQTLHERELRWLEGK